jgi:hypothetical protein
MAIEDGWVLGEHLGRNRRTEGLVDWVAALAAHQAVRPERCRRVVTASCAWGELWNLDGVAGQRLGPASSAGHPRDYTFVDWLHGPNALTPA